MSYVFTANNVVTQTVQSHARDVQRKQIRKKKWRYMKMETKTQETEQEKEKDFLFWLQLEMQCVG